MDPHQQQQQQQQYPMYPQPNQPTSSSVPGTSTPPQEVDRFTLLERKLEQFQETARHIGVIASDFNQRSQDTLNGKIYALIHGLQDLDRVKNGFADTKIPLEILSFLDEGKNPQLYSKEVLERTLQKNKEVNGKIEIYKKFRAHLLKEFGEEMPDLVLKYRNMRDDSDIV
ncbi:unnamed protein product [Caenorhabditis angaria]|uniref:Mediator of RNA polymerase II transcription subunit 10 n=1 Tax=Caenorhabditis angaria TaxID=860376 RepID=A0A9P1I8Z6_9PELO|nr:unnamed protein product [Caenorhabditis angaria]